MGHADQIRELGITAGSKNRPQTNSVTLDISENEINTWWRKNFSRASHITNDNCAGISKPWNVWRLDIRDKSAAGFIQRLIPNCKAQLDQYSRVTADNFSISVTKSTFMKRR